MSKLTLAHVSSDTGFFTTGNTFEEYVVKQDGTPQVSVRFEYAQDDSGDLTVKVSGNRDRLFQVGNDVQLLTAVLTTLSNSFGEDSSFYHEAFIDSEGDFSVELPIVLPE